MSKEWHTTPRTSLAYEGSRMSPGAQPTRPSLNLTPSPRLLEVIGEVDLPVWRCIAELADNCFDELNRAQAADAYFDARVYVSVPRENTRVSDAEVVVSDTGRGMTEDQLERALRAGSSGNQRFGSLGLLGMGFNLATARLGHLTEVWTGRAGDSHWFVASIDLRAMQRASSFDVPLRMEPKTEEEHGTKVIVRQLRDDVRDHFRRRAAVRKLREDLGDVYSYLLRNATSGQYAGDDIMGGVGIRLTVNDVPVKPRLPCVWDPNRSVTRQGADIPAVIKIDKQLRPAHACMACGHWHDIEVDTCTECGSDQVELRDRAIKGWIGIQRYLDTSDFGIDFLRQGRKIVLRDRSLFSWDDPNGLLPSEVEYPIELGATQGGRIVGEIHLDHIAVNYRKSDFSRDTRDWKAMVLAVRGASPLRPNIARQRNYPQNDSPLARLFTGYRRNDPGLKCLVPGNGQGPLRQASREWARKFRDGDPDYATDLRWYAAAWGHDCAKGATLTVTVNSSGTPITTSDVPTDIRQHLIDLGLGRLIDHPSPEGEATDQGGPAQGYGSRPEGDTPATNTESAAPSGVSGEPHVETEAERFERYRAASVAVLGLTGDVVLPNGTATRLNVLSTRGVRLKDLDRPTIAVARLIDGELEVYVDEDDSLFTRYGWNTDDIALVAAAEAVRTLFRLDEYRISDLVAKLTMQFPDREITDASLRARAADLLDRIRESTELVTRAAPGELWGRLSPGEQSACESAALAVSQSIDWQAAVLDGSWGRYASVLALTRLLEEVPDRFLDGHVFTRTWATWGSDEVRTRTVYGLTQLLTDVGAFLDDTSRRRPQELRRIALTLELMESEVVSR